MLKLTFVHALCLLALGVLGVIHTDNAAELRAFGVPGLFFGGATLFAAFFALKERRHGLVAAAFLSFLAFLTNGWGVLNTTMKGTFDPAHPGHRISAVVFVLCGIYVTFAVISVRRARHAAAIAALKAGDE